MKQYLDLLYDVLYGGIKKDDRTGTGTKSVFGYHMGFDLSEGFPLLTTKKLHFHSIKTELIWFLSGDSNIKFLNENGVTIWDEWANEDGELGPVYGVQWRNWKGPNGEVVDQIEQVIESLKFNPNSRRHVVTAWNPAELEHMVLPPCHLLFQFNVTNWKLSCQMYQRSADVFLGVPFNIASYALLTMMVAQVTGYDLGRLIISFGDTHLYLDHLEQAKEQLERKPKLLPRVVLNKEIDDIDDFTLDDIELHGYDAHPNIKAPVSA